MSPFESQTLPLFPLSSVLLPGAALGLRIFERRYLDLIRDCGRSGGGFGVCLILEGSEAGQPAIPAAYGTEAIIEDFDNGPDGLLNLQVRGARRFHVQQTRVRDNGLVVGQVQWLADDDQARLQPQHALLGTVLENILEQMAGAGASLGPTHLQSAAWVGWRLAQVLPLTPQQRLAVLQEDDPHARLQMLLQSIA
ncbi:LON peptidase substrate-binding domain-containing protein [Pseudoxanthomonas dokdonensis]|uniref:ATP-dependent protease n=1 Tax=Pseudoxanthomonas dokdonensis TaxID=344882 RepID=A0A0R0CK73_9GAMM|nr:LON peptidase substrate-binding domain-containing protein [Pseudoxanthomonas dokdonensis]KRG70005.1 ATP-dependent protease [Pseudoxanthomonas dokdonensis]